MDKKKILVAMSGGVDSTVCAHLIRSSGSYTEGVTMKLWSNAETVTDCDCPTPDNNCNDAALACARLGIKHSCIAFGDSFRKNVVDSFIESYIKGLTPNPCVECNKCIKFGALMEYAITNGFDGLATGHYAKIAITDDGEYVIKKANDQNKDQTYFLWAIKKEYLSRILFPLGDHTKDEIRAIAMKNGYESAHRSDSQDICFIPDGEYASFIRSQTKNVFPEGDFISADGKALGRHSGIINYTIGQRKGLGIALGKPMFVAKKNAVDNTVTLCDNEELFDKRLTAHSVNILKNTDLTKPQRVTAKIRYRHAPAPATAQLIDNDTLCVIFDEPQRAITPGQSVVIYDDDILIGGGIIS